MRLGVLDVGSNTVHLLVVDAFRGTHPWPAYAEKSLLRLAERIGPDGRLPDDAAAELINVVAEARDAAGRHDADELLAFATSAVRDATNGLDVLRRVREETGVDLRVLPGEGEARMTFLAVRRWFGWSTGRLLNVDIGGGSLEIACGVDEAPDVALSVPLGAGRLTRMFRAAAVDGSGPDRPPSPEAIHKLYAYVESVLDPVPARLSTGWDRAVATSKTFRMLARLAGTAPSGAGRYRPRRLSAASVRQVLAFVRRMPVTVLAGLDGVSASRAGQVLAGAVVADVLMRRLDIEELDICPWALREGLILSRLDAS